MLKRVKELFTNNGAKNIALHMLKMDCKVKETVYFKWGEQL